jgi:hypothetical protein
MALVLVCYLSAINDKGLCTSYQYSGDQVKKNRWTGNAARMGDRKGAYRVLVVRPGGKRPRGRPKRRWENNIKMELQDVG